MQADQEADIESSAVRARVGATNVHGWGAQAADLGQVPVSQHRSSEGCLSVGGGGCTETWGEGWVLDRAMSVPTGRNTHVIMVYLLGTSQEGPECQEGAGRTMRERL